MRDHPNTLRNVTIVGGGTAGWMAAAALARLVGSQGVRIQLIESDAIGTVGVGEATIPQITLFNRLLDIDEDAFVKATQATYKLGIEFCDWTRLGHRYFHPFGSYGADMEGVAFHHFWLHQQQRGSIAPLGEFCLQDIAAREGRFMRPDKRHGNSPLAFIAYAFQFDASLYAAFLRQYAEARGVERIEGQVTQVNQHPETGFVETLTLDNGRSVDGELFIDCSGLRGLLIEQSLQAGYDDWSRWLPCNRAVAVPSENVGSPGPFTRSTARNAGWQWRIPLQHRTGNGHVFCDGFVSDDDAVATLMRNLDGEPLADPRPLRFTTGIRREVFKHNVVALGLAAGFMEPLESTSIHLIQTGLARLMTLFPTRDFDAADRDEYNRATRVEYEYVRDFLVLHYRQTERDDTEFWRHCQALPVSDHLQRKLDLYTANGRIIRERDELFTESSWLAVMHGQGLTPRGHHPIVSGLGDDEIAARLDDMHTVIRNAANVMPMHQEFLASPSRSGESI
ncbi:MAG: tryptophan halogenase family protein [Pseudomonadota bacterium]